MVCFICENPINKEGNFVVCDKCGRMVHRDCSALNASELKVVDLKGKRLLKFYCNECQSGVKVISGLTDRISELEARFTSMYELFDGAFKTMKDEIINLRESNIQLIHMLTNNAANVENNAATGLSTKVNISSKSKNKKVTRSNSTSVPVSSPHSAPVAGAASFNPSAPPFVSPKSTIPSEVIGCDTQADFRGVEKLKFLHLNNVSPGVSAEQVESYIIRKHNFNKSDVLVKALTSNNHYCSFKIGVRESVFGDLLRPNLWPEKVTIREFSNDPPRKLKNFNQRNPNKNINRDFL